MREVDTDGSGTMDFYEYLQVAMLLEQRKGILYQTRAVIPPIQCSLRDHPKSAT